MYPTAKVKQQMKEQVGDILNPENMRSANKSDQRNIIMKEGALIKHQKDVLMLKRAVRFLNSIKKNMNYGKRV